MTSFSGIKASHVEAWLEEIFLPEIERNGHRNSLLLFDKAPVHRIKIIQDLFQEKCPETFGAVLLQPVDFAKYVSPLDNGAHAWLDREFRRQMNLSDYSVESMVNSYWEARTELPNKHFRAWFTNCGLGTP